MSPFINHPLTQLLGGTVLHSLWQATLLAVVLWGLSRFRDHSPTRRYWLAYGALVTQLLLSLITLAWLFEPSAATTTVTLTEWTAGAGQAIIEAYTAGELELGQLGWLEKLYCGLALVWLLGLVVGSLRLFGGHWYLNRRLRRGLREIPASWQVTVRALAVRLQLSERVTDAVRLSHKVGSPALVGLFKPLILFPVAVVNQLEPEEAEALLAHELAHYAAKDHWWNFLQSCIELLFYCNPAVHWIGRRIREEREFRCDRRVAELGCAPLTYASALYKIEAQRLAPQLSLAARPGSLLGRIEFLLRKTPNYYQMKPALLLFLLLIVGTLFSAQYREDATPPEPVCDSSDLRSSKLSTTSQDTLPPNGRLHPILKDKDSSSRQTIMISRNGEDVEMHRQGCNVTYLEINGREIPKAEYDQHRELIEELSQEITPPAPPAPPMPPMAPTPPTPPAAPYPGYEGYQGYQGYRGYSPGNDEIDFEMSITEDAIVFDLPDSDSVFVMDLDKIADLNWMGDLGGLIGDALEDGEVSPEREALFERAVEEWAKGFNYVLPDAEELDLDEKDLSFNLKVREEDGHPKVTFRNKDGEVVELTVPQREELKRSLEDMRAEVEVLREIELDLAEDREQLTRSQRALEAARELMDEQASEWSAAYARGEVHLISAQRFARKVKDFQRRGLINGNKLNRLQITESRMKVNGKKVSKSLFDRFRREYAAEHGIEWNELEDFDIDLRF